MPLANLEEALGLVPRATLPRLGTLRRKAQQGFAPADDDEAALEAALQQSVRDMPAEAAGDSPHGGLQTALDLLDLPRNAVANLINLGVGAEPTSKETFAGLPRVTGADLLRQLGLSAGDGDPDAPFLSKATDAVTGFAADVALDPLSYLTFGTGAILGSGARKVGRQILTEGGEKLLTRTLRKTQGEMGRRMFARALETGAERDAARQAARQAVEDTARGFGRLPTTHPAYTPDPRGGLGLAFDTQRGQQAVRERLADELAQQAPEIIDRTAIGLQVPFTKLRKTLVTKTALRGALEATGVARAGRALRAGAGAVVDAARQVRGLDKLVEFGEALPRELRKRFSTEPLPAIPGDPADAARFEAETFGKFAERETSKAMRRVGIEESRKLNRWIGEIEKETGLKRPVARAAVFALAERMNSREPGNVIAQRIGALVRELGGTDAQAGKLVQWVAAEEAPLRTALGRVPDLSPEIDLFGNIRYEPLDGPQLTLWNEEGTEARRPRGTEVRAEEPTDTLRAMTAQVVPTIPGKTAPGVAAVKKALIDRYGALTVEQALRDAKLRTPGADAQIQGAIDHATKGGWLFGAPPGDVEKSGGLLKETGGGLKESEPPLLPDLAPAELPAELPAAGERRALKRFVEVWGDEVVGPKSTTGRFFVQPATPTAPRRPLQDGDVIVTRIGGRVQVYREGDALPRNFLVLRPGPEVDSHFLAATLQKRMPQLLHGTAQQAVTVRDVANLAVQGPPPLAVQRHAAAGVRAADEALRRAQRLEETARKVRARTLQGLPDLAPAGHATETPEFREWFGDSQAVDEAGNPQVFYHGTRAPGSFRKFDPDKIGRQNAYGPGFYFSSVPSIPNRFAGDHGSLLPVFLALRNPLKLDEWPAMAEFARRAEELILAGKYVSPAEARYPLHEDQALEQLRKIQRMADGVRASHDRPPLFMHLDGEQLNALARQVGYDGLTLREELPASLSSDRRSLGETHTLAVAFEPTQIKSATANRGTFSRTAAEIDLAPAKRTLGEKLTLLDGQMNEYDGELAVVDADALLASHSPVKDHGEIVRIEPRSEYPVGFQARERSADASLAQIRGIAKNPKFELLLDFGPDVTSGPPIVANVGGRDVVVQGNGRTAGMLGWTDAQWKQYRDALGERIDIPAGMKRPVLVRRLTGDVDSARRMAALGNESAMLRKSRIERAREALNLRGGDTIPPVRVLEPVTRDNVVALLTDKSNHAFAEWLMQGLPAQRRAELQADPGALAEKVNDAFVAMLPRKVQEIAAGMPQEIEDMFTAAAPVAARMYTGVREGRVRPEYDLYSALEQAATLFGQMRGSRGSYKKIISDLDKLAATDTFAGMSDDLANATMRGAALAIGLVKASKSINPSEYLLEALGNIARTAVADDPRQMGFLAADPIEAAARLYLDTFVGPKQTEKMLEAMQAIKQNPARRAAEEAARAAEDAARAAETAKAPAGPAETGGTPIPQTPAAPTPEALATRATLYDDVKKWAASAGIDEQTTGGMLTVLDHFSDDAVRGLRLEHGTPEEAARVAKLHGMTPAAAFYSEKILTPAEKAVMGARGIVRMFQRAGKDYDDIGLLLEEFGHHVHRNVLTQADRDVISAWYDAKTTAQWAEELRQRGVKASTADYYAKNEYELFSRHFADYVMGKEVAASPEMRSLWQKTLDALKEIWTQLVGSGAVATDKRIAALIEKHYRAPKAFGVGDDAARAALPGKALQRPLIPEPRGVLGVDDAARAVPITRPGPQPSLIPPDIGIKPPADAARLPYGEGFTPEMDFPAPPRPGPAGELRMSDPVRQVVDYIQGRASLRIGQERAAGVPAAKLTTEREIGHLTRFLLDDPKSKLGGLIRQSGQKIKSWAQLQRADWWREKFADEINDVVKQVNLYQQGKSAGDARVHQLVEGLRLRQGETLPEVLMDPVVAHVARELESVKLIGSAEFLKESARRFGTLVPKGEKTPAGLVRVNAGQFGDLLDGVAFRPEVAQLLERHVGQWQEVSKPLAAYRGVLGLWKGAALLAPAYHLRNVFGNIWNSMLLGGFSLAGYRDAMAVQHAVQRGTNLGRRIAGTPYTIETLWKKMAVDGGVLGSGFFGTEGRVTRERVGQMLEALENPASARRALGEAGALHPFKANFTIGQIFEEQAKIGFVITRLRAGDDLGTALAKMKKALFDYGDLTDFERGTATVPGVRDGLPFYTWTRKNSELLLSLAFNNPGKLALVPKVQGDVEASFAGRDTLPASLRPAFIQKEGGIQVSGGMRPQFVNAAYVAPIGELALVNPLAPGQAAQKLMDSVAGPAKTAAELAANWDSFQDKPIREYPEQRKEFAGVPMPPELAHVARTVRPLNAVNQAIRSVESSGSTGQAVGNIAAQTLGVRTFAVDVPRQVFEAERGLNVQIGAMRRDMKRRIAELQQAGQPAAGDGELARLLAGLQELTARRDALPLREVRAAIKPLSERRKKMLGELVAAGTPQP